MKVEQEKVFEPVVIVLETPQKCDTFINEVCTLANWDEAQKETIKNRFNQILNFSSNKEKH